MSAEDYGAPVEYWLMEKYIHETKESDADKSQASEGHRAGTSGTTESFSRDSE
jgi:hypothetical protein